MPRPEFVTDEDINRWSNNIDQDTSIPASLVSSPIVREVCYAGLWLNEQLQEMNCPDSIIVKLQWTAGKLSFGRDAWEVHQTLLTQYSNNELIFEDDPDAEKN
jgi:hypothetical protein